MGQRTTLEHDQLRDPYYYQSTVANLISRDYPLSRDDFKIDLLTTQSPETSIYHLPFPARMPQLDKLSRAICDSLQ